MDGLIDVKFVIYDDFNSRVVNKKIIGMITPNCGASALRNGFKIIEVIINNNENKNNYDKNKTSN